ncbi:histidine kinase [Streptomyces sp. DSM 44915]|uniref:histidine kinase n=1 Tax=Streptomyces chisholmiae TaxID=3075540 RepID=A0ABU2JK54_9ACTN|nr:histidine kinase [Streptomyces sp. DSM 44915]MDT0265297.1 histidine kinase [Streptomyces sp. DSM 44915]
MPVLAYAVLPARHTPSDGCPWGGLAPWPVDIPLVLASALVSAGRALLRGSGLAPVPCAALTDVIAWLLSNSAARTRAHAGEPPTEAETEAVTAKRLSVARETHGTIAHGIGVVAVRAGAAARVVASRPAGAREPMLTAEWVGRETSAGPRRTLGALREADRAPAAIAAERSPGRALDGLPEGLADVPRSVETVSAVEVRAEVCCRGRRRPRPVETELAAFRVGQESVTNVVRRADADCGESHIDSGEAELAIEIRDRGQGSAGGAVSGYGLAGMAERVPLLRDGLAGPRPERGVPVAARLPVPVAAAVGRAAEPAGGAG